MSFAWIEDGLTPETRDLGKRIADAIRKHGYTEHSWLIDCTKRRISQTGCARWVFTITQKDGGSFVYDTRLA